MEMNVSLDMAAALGMRPPKKDKLRVTGYRKTGQKGNQSQMGHSKLTGRYLLLIKYICLVFISVIFFYISIFLSLSNVPSNPVCRSSSLYKFSYMFAHVIFLHTEPQKLLKYSAIVY